MQNLKRPASINFEEAKYRLEKGRREASKAVWVEARVKELVPKWYWWILQKTGSSILSKAMMITVGEDMKTETINIWRWGKLKFTKCFVEESNIARLN